MKLLPRAPRFAGVLSILILATIVGANGTACFGQFVPLSPEAHGSSPYQITPHMRGLAIPTDPKAPNERDFGKLYDAWMHRTIIANFPADKDPKGAAFVTAAADCMAMTPSHLTNAKSIAMALSFPIGTQTDAAIPLFIGIIDPSSPIRIEAFEKALQLMPTSKYPKFIWFMAASNLAAAENAAGADPSIVAKDDATALGYLDQAFNDDSFLPGEDAALRWRVAQAPSFDGFSRRNALKINDVVDKSTKLENWVKEFIKGVDFKNEAWNERGTGWANSVSNSGWKGFADNLAFARSHLASAWMENQKDPGAATEMIAVAMGDSEETNTMRLWFDRAVAADLDYELAYSAYIWGLRPRWLGSIDEMNAFGRECAATNRYDTMVPYERVQVALDVTDDLDDHGKQLMDPQVSKEILAVLNNYFAQPDPPIPAQFARTLAAVLNHKLGNMDEAKKDLEAINYQPMDNEFFQGMDDLQALVQQAKSAAGK